jgi:predicted extracellular nuclease
MTTSVGEPSLQIHDIQGCNHTSAHIGKKVTEIQGIVTWKDDQGFYIQDIVPDNEDCSSEALYVFTNQYSEVIPGDLVSVSGEVNEFVPNSSQADQLTITEIKSSSVNILSGGNSLPDPVIIGLNGRIPPDKIIEDDAFSTFDPNSDGIDFYESLEGMRVEIDNAIVVSPEDEYKEIYVIPGDMTSKNLISMQGALIASSQDDNPERIMVALPLGNQKVINVGTRFTQPIVGILSYAYGNYEIIETNTLSIQQNRVSVLKLSSSDGVNTLRVATYNTDNLNRFDTVRINELASQIVHVLGMPDLLVLEEIQDDSGEENDGTISAVKTLQLIVDKIIELGGHNYSYIDNPPQNNSSGGVGGGNIRTVMLYRIDRGLKLDLNQSEISTIGLSVFGNSRIPVVRLFTFHNQPVYLIGVHLVSNNANSPLFGSIQPILKPDDDKRLSQATWIENLVSSLQANKQDATILLVGDFNDTPDSKPLEVLQKAGFNDLAQFIPESERYSILFQGNAYLYDQILFKQSSSIFAVSDVNVIHINTYLNANQQNSDHDPFVVDLVVK